MTARTFTMLDQRRFAALSGDHNPLHLDLLVARRSMLGGIAVHGMHALLWALDGLAAQASFGCFGKLRVNFDQGVLVDEKVQCTWKEEDARWVGRITGDAGTLVRVSLVPLAVPPSPWPGRTEMTAAICEENEMDDLSGRSGVLDLILPSDWRGMFPHLAAASPPVLVAALLASTRLVGMRCPGLHSLYSALQLNYAPQPDARGPDDLRLHYKVVCADPRVRLLDMAVDAGPLHGVLNTFVRPKPFAQPRLAEILASVPPTAFARQNALVIGGSRGLGELASKLLAAGGAHVTLTWRQGEAEARAHVREAESLGLNIRAMKFDVAAPPAAAPDPDLRYTHLYYFATPHIRHGTQGQFNPAVFSEFLDCYVGGFARAVDWFRPRAEADARVWYPSTVFLAGGNADFPEYTAAKACGEALCHRMGKQLAPMTFVTPRLPRLPTDQTQSLATTFMADGVTTLLKALLDPSPSV